MWGGEPLNRAITVNYCSKSTEDEDRRNKEGNVSVLLSLKDSPEVVSGIKGEEFGHL